MGGGRCEPGREGAAGSQLSSTPPNTRPFTPPQEKEKWKFLQKYYHKGAYFQDEDETGNNKLGPVMVQDFGKATGKDSVGDKAAMPKVTQSLSPSSLSHSVTQSPSPTVTHSLTHSLNQRYPACAVPRRCRPITLALLAHVLYGLQVMQVKNFGMRSQVKWTHLTAEDTAGKDKDPLWAANQGLYQKQHGKLAGHKVSSSPTHVAWPGPCLRV